MRKYFKMIEMATSWESSPKRELGWSSCQAVNGLTAISLCPPVLLRGRVYTLGPRSLEKETLGFLWMGSGVLQMLLSFIAGSQWKPLVPPRPRILPPLEPTLCCWTPPGTTLPSATPYYPTSTPSSTAPTAGGTRWPGLFCMSKFPASKGVLLTWLATWTVSSNVGVSIETLRVTIQIPMYFFNWDTQLVFARPLLPPYCSRGVFKWYSLFPFGDRSRLKSRDFGVFVLLRSNSLS